MSSQGYIKLHRQITEWEWYKNIPVKILFLHCLLRANHADKKWQGILIKKGSFITSLDNLAFETGLTKRQVRTALDKLKMTHELTHQTTHQYSIIIINNWDKFQIDDTPLDTQATCKRHTNDTQATLNNNDKNDNNEKKYINNKENFSNFEKPTKEEIKKYANQQLGKSINNVDEFISWYDAQGWLDNNGFPINWKQKVQSWIKRNQSYNQVDINKQQEEELDGWSL